MIKKLLIILTMVVSSVVLVACGSSNAEKKIRAKTIGTLISPQKA